MSETDEKTVLTESSKEIIKMRAAFLNGIAIATFAVGTLGSLVKGMTDDNMSSGAAGTALVLSVICLVLAAYIHLKALQILKGLDQ